jgi:hypothetical protein
MVAGNKHMGSAGKSSHETGADGDHLAGFRPLGQGFVGFALNLTGKAPDALFLILK